MVFQIWLTKITQRLHQFSKKCCLIKECIYSILCLFTKELNWIGLGEKRTIDAGRPRRDMKELKSHFEDPLFERVKEKSFNNSF